MSGPRLEAVVRDPAAFADRIAAALAAGAKTLAIQPEDAFAGVIRARLPAIASATADTADVLCLTHPDPAGIDRALLDQIDRSAGTVLIPALAGHGLDRPLFLVSIPKAGTHLLYRLAEALGFRPGIVCPDQPNPGA
jgi:hypothetical protein